MPVSQMLTDFYKKYFEGTKTNCVFIPHSLDYIPREVSALESKKIISIGRLSPEKGFDDLLDVFKIVNNQKKDWKLDIIGDGVLKNHLINKVKEYSLQNNVIIHGYKDKEFINELPKDVPNYNFKTKHDTLFNGKNGYIFDKEFILKDIKEFVEKGSVN